MLVYQVRKGLEVIEEFRCLWAFLKYLVFELSTDEGNNNAPTKLHFVLTFNLIFVSVPGKAPQLLTLVNVGAHSVHITWNVVEWSRQNGFKMEYYDLKIKNLRTDRFEVFKHHDITNQGDTNFGEVVADLKGLTPYLVYVALVNEVGLGPASSTNFTTLESGESRVMNRAR